MTRYFIHKNGITTASLSRQDLIAQFLSEGITYDEQGHEIGEHTWTEITEAEYLVRQPKEVEPNANELKIVELKQKLANTDYLAIKHSEGRLTDAEYQPISDQRQAWRNEINALEIHKTSSVEEKDSLTTLRAQMDTI